MANSFSNSRRFVLGLGLLWCATLLVAAMSLPSYAQETPEQASVTTTLGSDGTGRIIVEAHGEFPKPPEFYVARASADVRIEPSFIEQVVQLSVELIQGEATQLSFGLNGPGQVTAVQGEGLKSWSIRQEGDQRFLDLHVAKETKTLNVEVKIRSSDVTLPSEVELAHLAPGKAVGFNSTLTVHFATGVEGTVSAVEGFAPLADGDDATSFQTSSGGQIKLSLTRDGAAPRAVELSNTQLTGELHADGSSMRFRLESTAEVTEPNAKITILSGNAAVVEVPTNENYRLELSTENDHPVYNLIFTQTGSFPVTLDFVAKLIEPGVNRHRMDFTVAASAVVPLTLTGLDEQLEFEREEQSVVPLRDGDDWLGFLPATGRAKLEWRTARRADVGKLFFATTSRVETKVGAGLLRQDHYLDYQVLQGELTSIRISLRGPGEILDVQGRHLVSWNVSETGDERQLDITLSQPISDASQIHVRSQTPMGAFPVRVEGMRLVPVGSIRHSGYLRLTNLGSVRLEPVDLTGLTQLAPEQFPGDAIEARQIFVYRFPAADYSFSIAADRIQPEVNVTQLVLYELAETDRAIKADIELDVREAPIREWDLSIPADYSVVSVTGASVADYVAATAVADGLRNLKLIFNQDVAGRQLVRLSLEKNEATTETDWVLPRLEFPEAKTLRGDIGVVGAPGFRIAVGATNLLVEKPLSYFPNPTKNLQQAFRIREPGWSATMQIERLARSVQADVFHLYSLSQETVYGSALINYFVTGAPVAEWSIRVPTSLGNIMVDGQDVRTFRREDDTLIVSLHQPVMGPYTLLLTFEEKPNANEGAFVAGQITPLDVQGERGYIQVVSPMQVEISTVSIDDEMLKLDALELPAELRLLSTAPALGTWQYTERPIDLALKVNWFEPGTTVTQVIEFSEANSRVSSDGELVTDVLYYVKSRGERTLRIKLPGDPVRLWEVSVNGEPVTARQADDATLIPLPGGTDPNVPVEVRLRIGKPSVAGTDAVLTLPIVDAPVLKTQWGIRGDEKHILVPSGGSVSPAQPVLRPTGFDWVARKGVVSLVMIGFFTIVGKWATGKPGLLRCCGLLILATAIGISISTAVWAYSQSRAPTPLNLSLPILPEGEAVELLVKNVPLWQANVSPMGIAALIGGILVGALSLRRMNDRSPVAIRALGLFLIAIGVLAQRDAAPWFYALLGLGILLLLFLRPAWDATRGTLQWLRDTAVRRRARRNDEHARGESGPDTSAVPTAVLLMGLLASLSNPTMAAIPAGFKAADSITQQWQLTHADARLIAKGTITVSGQPGDRFFLLRAPAVLTEFQGPGLRLTKQDVPGYGLSYVISIPSVPSDEADEADDGTGDEATDNARIEATFEYQLEGTEATEGIPVLTGLAAVHQINLSYDEAGWDVTSDAAIQIEAVDTDDESTQAKILLGPEAATLQLKPKVRDVTTEETRFFVEASNLYIVSPGVVDGRHRLHIRASQGQVSELIVLVPDGLTVSGVDGPVGFWQFDAEKGRLKLDVEPPQSQTFDVTIATQRSLAPLPSALQVSPLTVEGDDGEVGLVAIAFGPEAQPETIEPNDMSAVNLSDFDASLMPQSQAVLHRVYRYGADGGSLAIQIAPVDAEVRVISKQVLSLGDERVVLGINFAAEITRAGLFQLSFPLPEGLEVESLTGPALHHWSELTDEDKRQIILHLNGKTLGAQRFSLTLTGPAPTDASEWEIPRFELTEATRQTGDLVVRPTTGIRLRTVSRQNVSEIDPRSMGGDAQGALAFRLLQQDWNLVLGIEILDPWVTGQLLQEATLREGQTRSALIANFMVQNAAIRSLQIALPLTDEDEIKTLRATGAAVSDLVRTAADSNIWELQLKRRVVGALPFRIEYERRGDRVNDTESLAPASFPQARQLTYFVGVRAGGRLELEHDTLPAGWQRADWNTVPQPLREAGNRSAPALLFRAVAPTSALQIRATRHSLADALKLRVASGTLTTVLSATGDQLTAVDVTMEVIQRSSLSVGLPTNGELLSIFVNGESVHSIRQGGTSNVWQFYILPGIDDRSAKVRFVYSVPGKQIGTFKLISPQLNVPLENIEWNVVVPMGYQLIDNEGDLELVRQTIEEDYDRDLYLSKISGRRQVQAERAVQLLEQANELLQAGEQAKARWALNSVANQYALDAASNEDARVQLENLQTQQAIVGLNTRRQRLYLDNDRSDAAVVENEQLRQAAADNPILQQDQLNFRPQQLSQLLQGNTSEDNAVLQQIAARLVQHQRTTEPAPQAIVISMPEEGDVYTFSRTVQVAEDAPLTLDLRFAKQLRVRIWQAAIVLAMLAIFALAMSRSSGSSDEATPPPAEAA